jgi:uncharacterized protein YxjI
MGTVNYPLELSFKKLALAHQLSVTDATGNLVWYVKQKMFKLKEEVTVFGDREQTRPLFQIKADRVIDFSARYTIRESASGMELGAIQRRGMRSIWRAQYEIARGGTTEFRVAEENPWIKVADHFFRDIPVVGILSGYVFHPSYLVTRAGGSEVARIEKKPAFFEGRFDIEQLTQLRDDEEKLVLVSLMMMLLLERSRG